MRMGACCEMSKSQHLQARSLAAPGLKGRGEVRGHPARLMMVSGRAGGRLARGIFRRFDLDPHKAAKGLLPGRLRAPSGRPAPCPDTRDASRSASLVGRGWAMI